MLTPPERVSSLEKAFYTYSHDRDRIAAVLMRAADMLMCELPRDRFSWDSRYQHHAHQRCAGFLRLYAKEVLSYDSSP